jgi:hypothetical protein
VQITIEDAEGAVDTANDLRERIKNLGTTEFESIYGDLKRLIAHVEAGTLQRNFRN